MWSHMLSFSSLNQSMRTLSALLYLIERRRANHAVDRRHCSALVLAYLQLELNEPYCIWTALTRIRGKIAHRGMQNSGPCFRHFGLDDRRQSVNAFEVFLVEITLHEFDTEVPLNL